MLGIEFGNHSQEHILKGAIAEGPTIPNMFILWVEYFHDFRYLHLPQIVPKVTIDLLH